VNWIIADQSLTSYMGHSFEYARAIRGHLLGLGQPATVLASVRASRRVIEALGAVPCFRYGLDHDFAGRLYAILPRSLRQIVPREWNYFRHRQGLFRDLVGAESKLALTRDTIVLFHTIRHNHVLPIVKWAERLRGRGCPRFSLILRFTAYPTHSRRSPTAAIYRRALGYLEQSPVRDRFRLFTDSNRLAWEYREHTSIPVAVLPIPHVEGGGNGQRESCRQGGAGPIRLTYAGDARVNKGFHLLPYLFEHLEPLRRTEAVAGEVQANVRNDGEWEVKTAVRRLRRAGVELVDHELSSGDYYALLDRAGIVLLPYTLDYYHAQTSGIFAEAVARGKPVVVPRGSWMAEQLGTFGAGTTFPAEDRQGLLEAVLSGIQCYDQLRAQAVARSRAWTGHHNPRAFVDTILSSF